MAITFTSLFKDGQFLANTSIPGTDFLLNSGNLFPKWPDTLSPTAVETWLFDAMTEDGSTAFTVSFFRDGSEASGSLRVAINAFWSDGTVWGHHIVVPVSSVTSTGSEVGSGHVVGVWRNETSTSQDNNTQTPEYTGASFDIAADLSAASVTFNVPGKITGTLTHHSREGYPTLPTTSKEAEVAPEAYWFRPIAMADATLDMTFHIDNPDQPGTTVPKRMLIGSGGKNRGFGGMDRSWLPKIWAKEATDALFVRAIAGPYVLAMMRLVGTSQGNYQATATAVLYKEGKVVCRPLRVLPADRRDGVGAGGGEDAVRVERIHTGEGVAARFRDKNVGYRLEFRSPHDGGKKWGFELRHQNAWWAKPTSRPGPDGTGNSGFIVNVVGGLVGQDEVFTGWGMTGEVELPD